MRKWINSETPLQRVGVLLFDAFSNHCLANTVEPLRAANRLSGKRTFEWRILTLDGLPAASSSGLRIEADGRLADHGGEVLVVMPSYDFLTHATPATARALRAASGRYRTLAGFDTGAWLLADAGLLAGRRATIHWEELGRFAEAFPEVTAQRARAIFDGDRITCVGAQAAFDVTTRLIGDHLGEAVRLDVAALFMSPEVVGAAPESEPLRPRGRSLSRALALMQESLENPLSVSDIAARVGLSQRVLDARMQAEFGAGPATIYRRLRLTLARKLTVETDLPVSEIALRSGYQNPAAMTRAFRTEFGTTPRALRGQ